MHKTDSNYKIEAEAWLRLIYITGVGPKTVWNIYYRISKHNINIANIFTYDAEELKKLLNCSPDLINKILASNNRRAEERFETLLKKNVRIHYPGCVGFCVPEIPSLSPILTSWGDLSLLNEPEISVLMKSNDTSDSILKAFLHRLSEGEISHRNWCFCPFSKADWELTESLLRLNCGLILGFVSNITLKSQILVHDLDAGRALFLAVEPPVRSRRAIINCLESLYRLFGSLTKQVFILNMQKGSRTETRAKWAKEMNCTIDEFTSYPKQTTTENGDRIKEDTISSIDVQKIHKNREEGDVFISCL